VADLVERPELDSRVVQRVTKPVVKPRVLTEAVQEYDRRGPGGRYSPGLEVHPPGDPVEGRHRRISSFSHRKYHKKRHAGVDVDVTDEHGSPQVAGLPLARSGGPGPFGRIEVLIFRTAVMPVPGLPSRFVVQTFEFDELNRRIVKVCVRAPPHPRR